MADPVEVDAGRRLPVHPPGELAVRAVQHQVQLDEQRADDGGGQPAERDHHAGGDAAADEGGGHRVGRPPEPGENPGQVRRQLAAVEPTQPVLVVEPVEHLRWLALLPQLSQRRPAHSPPLAWRPRPATSPDAPGSCTGPAWWPGPGTPPQRTARSSGRGPRAGAASRTWPGRTIPLRTARRPP